MTNNHYLVGGVTGMGKTKYTKDHICTEFLKNYPRGYIIVNSNEYQGERYLHNKSFEEISYICELHDVLIIYDDFDIKYKYSEKLDIIHLIKNVLPISRCNKKTFQSVIVKSFEPDFLLLNYFFHWKQLCETTKRGVKVYTIYY